MNAAVLPLIAPLLTALATLFWSRPTALRRGFVALSAAAQLGLALALAAQTFRGPALAMVAGRWTAPFGIVLVIDLPAALMVALSSFTALATVLYGYAEQGTDAEHPLRLPLLQFILAGINLSFVTGDLFNLFVAFEVMLIASYALLTLEVDDWDVRHAFPYLVVNLVGSTLFLCAAGLAYAIFGTLSFADIILRAADMRGDPRVTVLALMLLVVFGIKAGLFPLYYWLPHSYPTLPAPLAAFFAGMLTKVGVYVLVRVFGTVLPHELSGVHTLLVWLASATMILGVLGAISRGAIRGILSFHILSQIGFMVLAIGLFTPLSIAACIFYVIHHIIVKSSLFLVGNVAARLNGTDELERMGGLWRKVPWVGVLFLVQALSLAGLPPLSGFWGKYVILVSGLGQGAYGAVAASLAASILTLFSMLKIWNGAFWSEGGARTEAPSDRRWVPMSLVVAGMVVVSLGIGLGSEGVLRLATEAATQALDQEGYARLVFAQMGKGGLP